MIEKNTLVKFCLSPHLFNILQNFPKDHLIIDTRTTHQYNQKSIYPSLNLNEEYLTLNKDNLPKLSREDKAYSIKINIESDIGEESKMIPIDQVNAFVQAKKVTQEVELRFNFSSLLAIANETWKVKIQKCKRKYCILIINHKDMLMDHIEPEMLNSGTTSFHLHYFEKDQYTVQKIFEKIYLPDDPELSSISFGLRIHDILMKQGVKELYIMVEGAERFFENYPFIEKNFSGPMLKYPNDILDRRIFLGDASQALNQKIIKNLKITHIVNCAQEIKNAFEGQDIKYFRVSVTDENFTLISDHFKDAYDFIDQTIEENQENRILIHCKLGRSRSAAIAIMFLMKKFSLTYEKAYEYLKDKRDIVCPNLGFVEQLEQFEEAKYEFNVETIEQKNNDYDENCIQSEIEVPTS